jgi:hypothetical protein
MPEPPPTASSAVEALSLNAAVTHLLEECRMILPGLQALLGFQLIVVFQPAFSERLTQGEQRLHLASLTLLAIAMALVMTPAAYHRQTRPQQTSRHFLFLGGRLLMMGLVPLMIGIAFDVYLIAHLILGGVASSVALAAMLLAIFAGLWFLLPRWHRLSGGAGPFKGGPP